MSEAFDFDLSDVDDFDDVKLENADDYQDQTDPAPIAPGVYRFSDVKVKRQQNKDGENIDDNGYPVIVVQSATVVEPEELKGRQVFPFKKYSLRPVQDGERKGTVPAVDLLRGFDDTVTFATGKEVLQLIGEQVSQGKTLVARTNWIAKDGPYMQETIEEAGGMENMSAEERKTLFNAAIFRGQKKFPKNNGVYLPEVEGPSGDTLTAKVDFTRIYPASKEIKKLGPFGPKNASK